MRKLISPHLSIREVRCRCGCKTGGLIDPYTASLFELIREACGGNPLVITSGWRCIKHNKAVGGHPKSFHLLGMALDLRKPNFMSLDEFYIIADEFSGDAGLGKYLGGWLHIDCGNIVGLQKHRRWVK